MKFSNTVLKWVSVAFIYNVLLDFVNPEVKLQEILVLLQYFLMSIPIILIASKIRNKYFFSTLFILLTYMFFISLGSSDYLISYNHNLKVLFSSLFLVVGYYSINTYDDLKTIIKLLVLILFLFVIYILTVNVYNIGEYLYGDSGIIRTGYLSGARIYPYSIIVILIPLIASLFPKYDFHRISYFLLSVISILLILLIARRTAVMIILLGYSLYLILRPTMSNVVKLSALLLILVTVVFINYDSIRLAYELRGERITNIDLITTERRFQEYSAILSTIKQDPSTLLFGTGELFNNRGGYGEYHWRGWRERRIHSDYGILLHGGGVIALSFYVLFILCLFKKARSLKTNSRLLKDLKVMLFSLIVISMFVSLSGGFYYVTYYSITMLLIGGIIRIIENNR